MGYLTDAVRNLLGIDKLEERMSATEDALRDLDQATNDVAAEVDELRAQVANFDQDTAAKLGVVAERLRGLAADPSQPVPPAPADPVVDPGAGEPQV